MAGSPSPQPSPLSNEKIDAIKNQIKEVVTLRLVPCFSNGFRYAIYKGEIIKIWHLQMGYGQSELLREDQKANGSWFKQNFQFVKSDSIPKGEANDLLYQSYDPTENSWSKWKVFAPQSFTAEFIENKSPSIPEFYASYIVPRSGLCQAIKEQSNLGEFLKTDSFSVSVSPSSLPEISSKESYSDNSSTISPTPTPNIREQAKNSLSAKAIVEKYFERELKCNSNYYLVQGNLNYWDGSRDGNSEFNIWEFTNSNYEIKDISFSDNIDEAIIFLQVTGGKRYEWNQGCDNSNLTSKENCPKLISPNTRIIDFQVIASRRNGEWQIVYSNGFKPENSSERKSCDQVTRFKEK